ncbi:hypothetical protein ScalyP_jg5868 [Parmales sp. scaly parma]|nr:hypothetical protein ScalyP_jg5868 [Parmales sp. scaly parma]
MLMRFRSTDYSGKLQRVELYTSSSDRSAVDEEILVLCDKVHEPVGVEVGVKVGVADHATTTLNAISISTSAVPQSNSPHHDLLLQTHKRSIFSHVIGPLLHASELAAIMHDESKGGSDTGSKQVLGGLVIHGLSGSGKSSLALAIGASMVGGGVKTIVCNCNELIKKEMGGSERSVRSKFGEAKVAASENHGVVLIFENLEAIARNRNHSEDSTGGAMDRILATFLVEMDGVEYNSPKNYKSDKIEGKIAVIGVTQNLESIDPAIRRSGRLGGVIGLGLPDPSERVEIVKRAFALQPPDGRVNFEKLAIENGESMFDPKSEEDFWDWIKIKSGGRSRGFCGALCNEAGRFAVREFMVAGVECSVGFRHYQSCFR